MATVRLTVLFLGLVGLLSVSFAAPVAETEDSGEEVRYDEPESWEDEMQPPPEPIFTLDGYEETHEAPPPPEDDWEEAEDEEEENWQPEGRAAEEPLTSDDSETLPSEEWEEDPVVEAFPTTDEVEEHPTETDLEGSGGNAPLPLGIELPPVPEFNFTGNYTIDETPPVDGNATEENVTSVLDNIIEINQGSGLFVGMPDGRSSCSEFECVLDCIFGYQNGPDGCPVCSCVPDGDEKLFEGDISLNEGTKEYLRNVIERDGRGASRRPLWTNKVVPYTMNRAVAYNSYKTNAINAAIREFHRRTCIRFVRRTNQRAYIEFHSLGGCFSNVGRTGSRQYVSIGNGCENVGTVIHELLHALGFWHEQSRPDRDSFVAIQWANIPQSVRYNFQKYTSREVNSLGSAYDLGSVMHYGSYAFSYNRRPTITDRSGRPIRTQRAGFSASDLAQLAALYRCSNTGGGGTGTGGGGTGTGGGGTGNGNCNDGNNNCGSWSRRGYCTSSQYRQYMRTNCRKSCSLCGGTGTGGGGTGTGNGSCRDNSNNCGYWTNQGHCRSGSYLQYMRTNCRKSCQLCSGTGTRPNPTSNCRDSNNNCPSWSRRGECTRNPTWMNQNCRKSCGRC